MAMDITKAIKRIPRHVFYKHYRGGIYRVLCVSLRENDAEPVVTYENEVGVVFTRPVFEWEELVDYGGRYIQRFVRLPAHVEPSSWPPRDDFETFDTPETRLRQQLSEAHAAIKAHEDSQFLDKLRAMGIPVPRMSMKDAAAMLGINYEELKAQFEDELELPKEAPPVPLKMWAAAANIDLEKLQEDVRKDPVYTTFTARDPSREVTITNTGAMLAASPRFADFCSLSCGEMDNWYEGYLKYRYPNELEYLKAKAEASGYRGCINWRVCDPRDAQDYELYLRMNTAATPEGYTELTMEVAHDTPTGKITRLLGFTYLERGTGVDGPHPVLTFTDVEVTSEKVSHKN